MAGGVAPRSRTRDRPVTESEIIPNSHAPTHGTHPLVRSRLRRARAVRARPRPRERRCRLVVMGSAERPRGDHLFLRDPLPNNSFAPAVICRRASGTADRAGAALGRPLKHVAPVQRARILTLAAKLLKSSEAQFSSGLRHGTFFPILRFGGRGSVGFGVLPRRVRGFEGTNEAPALHR